MPRPLVPEQHRRRVQPERPLHPGVPVQRCERDAETAQPLPLYPPVDGGGPLRLVFQQVHRDLVKEVDVEGVADAIEGLGGEVVVVRAEVECQLLVPGRVGARSGGGAGAVTL